MLLTPAFIVMRRLVPYSLHVFTGQTPICIAEHSLLALFTILQQRHWFHQFKKTLSSVRKKRIHIFIL